MRKTFRRSALGRSWATCAQRPKGKSLVEPFLAFLDVTLAAIPQTVTHTLTNTFVFLLNLDTAIGFGWRWVLMKSLSTSNNILFRIGCNKIAHNIQRVLVSGKMQRDLGLEKDTKGGFLQQTLPEEVLRLFLWAIIWTNYNTFRHKYILYLHSNVSLDKAKLSCSISPIIVSSQTSGNCMMIGGVDWFWISFKWKINRRSTRLDRGKLWRQWWRWWRSNSTWKKE